MHWADIVTFLSKHWSQIFVCVLLVMVFVSFLKEHLSPDVIAMGALVLLLVFPGVLDLDQKKELLEVFASPAPILIACMFILSAALEKTGVIKTLANWFELICGKSEWRIFLTMFIFVAFFSAVVSNTPIVIIFMPIVISIASKNDLLPSKFLIPLSYATIVGGTCTLIGTSTNVIASEIASTTPKLSNFKHIGMFEMSKLGIIYIVITFLYMFFIGRKLLPNRINLSTIYEPGKSKEYLSSVIVKENSPLINKAYIDTDLPKQPNLRIIHLSRNGKKLNYKNKSYTFQSGDEITFKTRLSEVMEISQSKDFFIKHNNDLGLQNLNTVNTSIMEGIIGTTSSFIGKTIRDLGLEENHEVYVLAVHRNGQNIKSDINEIELKFGDTILMEGSEEKMNQLFSNSNFINLSTPKEKKFRKDKAPFAIISIIGFLIIGNFTILPLSYLALAFVFFILLTRCIESKDAYQAIDWRIIFLIIGMLGLGKSLSMTGVADLFAHEILHIFGSTHPIIALAVIYLITALLTELISNQAVAVLITPLAIDVSLHLNVDPRPFVIAVMFAASASFSTPIGYQTNTYVYGAGGYKFSDFTKVGLPLAILLWIIACFLIPYFWKF